MSFRDAVRYQVGRSKRTVHAGAEGSRRVLILKGRALADTGTPGLTIWLKFQLVGKMSKDVALHWAKQCNEYSQLRLLYCRRLIPSN